MDRPVRVQLPGREDAASEPALRRVPDAVDGLLAELSALDRTPLAVYGHSMGALVAYELARALAAAGTPVLHLFVSGRRAPHLAATRQQIHRLPDPDFAAALAAMNAWGDAGRSASFLRYALRLTRSDLELSEEYRHLSEPRLECPITAFHGTADPIVDAAEITAWRELTGGPFVLHEFAGDHLFHHRHRAAIVVLMAEAVR